MRLWLRWAFILLAASSLLPAAGIHLGMTEAEVAATLGPPTAELRRGDRLILLYPEDGRVELRHGRVTAMARVPLGSVASAPTTASAPSPAPTPPSSDAAIAPAAEAEPAAAPADAMEQWEADEEPASPPDGWEQWGGVLLAFACKLLITVVGLKAAFAWADVHAEWAQMWLPALADGLVRTGLAVGAQLLLDTSELFYVDEAIGYFVLLGVLLKTTHACTLPRAVAVAGAAKLASIVVWSLASVVLLQLAFG